MNETLPLFAIELFLVFTRVGTCIMLLPGFSAAQLAPRLRLFIAAGISIAVYPQAADSIDITAANASGPGLLYLIVGEMLIGATFALPARLFMAALSFLGEVIMQMIGLNPIPGVVTEDGQVVTTLSAFFNVVVVTLFFIVGLHAQFIIAIAGTFAIIPPGEFLLVDGILARLRNSLSDAFLVVLRLGAPFVILVIAINMVSGIVNKLTPQIPVYFVAMPFMIAAGLALLYWIGNDMMALFIVALTDTLDWL